MNNKKIASELLKLAKELVSFQFSSPNALKEYLKEHPKSDKSKHTVKSPSKGQLTKDESKSENKIDKIKENIKNLNNTKKHVKKNVDKSSISRVKNVMKSNNLTSDSDEMKELAGFKKTLGQRIPDGDEGKYYVRNEAKLKTDFIKNMDQSNYSSPEAFKAAKDRLQKMSTSDFGKVLAAVNDDEE